jgi:hypothetical protein
MKNARDLWYSTGRTLRKEMTLKKMRPIESRPRKSIEGGAGMKNQGN